MAVPLLDLPAQNETLEPALTAAFQRVLGHGQFILGVEVERFERLLAEYVGCRHAIGMSSGTDALLVALQAAGVGIGDEVLCPSFTFFATAGCVHRLGARPVFVDVLEADFNLDPDDAARKISDRTRAIVPVHLFGQTAKMDAIQNLAGRCGLAIIEDAAQALGAKRHGAPAGTLGLAGCYSFFPTKNLGGLGDGGALVTHDDAFAERCRAIRVHGARVRYEHDEVGGNFRIDALQAAFLAVKLAHLDHYSALRAAHAAAYACALADCPSLILPQTLAGNHHIWNQYTILLPDAATRNNLRDHLRAHGIACEIYYPVPLHRQKCFDHLDPANCPVSDRLAARCLSLPIFPEMSPHQQAEVIHAIKAYFG
jgi:dTDP-4-amino-4,6-dideoxygalactose transaminase